jgi:hypothetical protein
MLHKVVTAAKCTWANDFLHNATSEQLWTAAKWHFGHKQRLIPMLTTDTGLSDQPTHMLEALKHHFFKTVLMEVPIVFLDDPPSHAPRSYAAITVSEIADALHPTSNNSTLGPLGHNYKLIKWAFTANPTQLLALFKVCLLLGHHLKEWKLAITAVILKPRKEDYSLLKCYHPLVLLECLGKLLKKVVMRCLSHDIAALKLIPMMQFRARSFSSTINAGLCLTHDVEIAHALGRVCGSLLFDLQGFFNNINHNRLTALIDPLGFPLEIGKWAASFLKGRSVCLQFNSYISDETDLEMGMPQGSPISPILSIIYASPLLHLVKCWTDSLFMMYVDDGNIFA